MPTGERDAQSASGLCAAGIDTALDALRLGQAVVFPTETFYGVGVDATNPRALELLFRLKGRDPEKPVALIASDLEMVARVVREFPPAARRLASEFWPGPLTIVMRAAPGLSPELINPEGGVGIRISPHPAAIELARRLGSPLTATSANGSGQPPARTLVQAWQAFGSGVAAYVDGGELAGSMPSTVVAVDGERIGIIRTGAISEDRLNQVLRR